MITLRRSDERGGGQHGWLDTKHTFSFADYHDPRHMGFRSLRVINEDKVAPGAGFPTHPHRDMEILTWVLEGSMTHRDSMGTGSTIRPGEIQRMSAGTGVTHSEFNASRDDLLHLLQIWIVPGRRGSKPSYEQLAFADRDLRGAFRVVASRAGEDGGVAIQQDATMLVARLAEGESARHALVPGRHAWLHVATGEVVLGEQTLHAGDGAQISGETEVALRANDESEVLLFDLG